MALLPALQPVSELPPILSGAATPQIRERVERFYLSIPEIFEAWVKRCESPHTQRAYRADVTEFIKFFGVVWPKDAWRLFSVTVPDVQQWRDFMVEAGMAPKTRNRRLSSLSHFFRYLGEAAKELRLPINVPNPAHAQFVPRKTADARDETRALTITRARQLLSMPSTETILGLRDRAIFAFYIYTGARIGTGCRVQVSDFHHDEDGATVTLHHKGDHRVVIGLHWQAAEAIRAYIQKAELTGGALFRPRRNSRSKKLANHGFHPATMYLLLQSYLERLPGAVKEVEQPDGTAKRVCIYTPHSLRATAATLLLGAGVDIRKVQELLGHRHVTTTQIYDKRRFKTSEGASHEIPI
jgi:site-specific recombinase XerD